MQQIQFIGTTPEQQDQRFAAILKSEIDALKKEFQPKTPTEYLTRSEVAEMLQIDLSTLHHWTKRGKLLSYGIGNRVYYKRQDVEAALQPLSK
jgi:excisionase family DNA binding protein